MKRVLSALWVAGLSLSMGVAWAQAGGAGPAPQASAPGAGGPRMGMGPGGGMRGGPRWGSDYTPGWAMMTPAEREAHREQMRATKTYEECQALRDRHREQMLARAKERGINPPAQPRRDGCVGLKR